MLARYDRKEPRLTVAGAPMPLWAVSLGSLLFFSGLLCLGFHSLPLDLSALLWWSVRLIYLHVFGCMSEPHLQNIGPNLQ